MSRHLHQKLTIGILSDTHLSRLTTEFEERVARCFKGVSVVLHAGDLTTPSLLKAFGDREIHAVHGNMCSTASCQLLPRKKTITLGNFTIGLIHRVGNSYDFEDQLLDEFEQVDCIVYGHTHRPACFERYGILFINPGSFVATSRFGSPGTYAILEMASDTLRATIHEVPF
ncbi:MAG: metallophosphoesterase [Desulfobulbaceae bacterium]|nr:metallophosphoesterase [Desulfobulbaceae bacterium]